MLFRRFATCGTLVGKLNGGIEAHVKIIFRGRGCGSSSNDDGDGL